MADSKGIKTSKGGLYWCNIGLSTGKYKIVIAELINDEPKIFKVMSNSSAVKNEPNWLPMENKTDWFFKEMFEEDINKFFNWNY